MISVEEEYNCISNDDDGAQNCYYINPESWWAGLIIVWDQRFISMDLVTFILSLVRPLALLTSNIVPPGEYLIGLQLGASMANVICVEATLNTLGF